MSTGTKIEWTEATWNPVAGCTRVSAGCDHCYAVAMTHRLERMGQEKYAGLTVLNNRGDRHFNGVVRCDEAALSIPLHWRTPKRIFVNSMSDLFHKDVPFEFIDRVFAVMALTPQHTYQILTKRPERMAEYFAGDWWRSDVTDNSHVQRWYRAAGRLRPHDDPATWPDHGDAWCWETGSEILPNVWLGASCEDQTAWRDRYRHLTRCPAHVRFISAEPLLGPLAMLPELTAERMINWVIVGGESGRDVRPCDVAWIRSIVEQCRTAGLPCFVKQLGSCARVDYYERDDQIREWAVDRPHTVWNPDGLGVIGGVEGVSKWTERDGQPRPGAVIDVHMAGKGGDPAEWPEDLRVREFPRAEVRE